ncbi:hypothetical protein HanRHA438_Chr05g0236561 [Helianthus annuus]|nr:hypothetical protein HanRHA438_Chr05g0236561 [Helianthus annuus]
MILIFMTMCSFHIYPTHLRPKPAFALLTYILDYYLNVLYIASVQKKKKKTKKEFSMYNNALSFIRRQIISSTMQVLIENGIGQTC